MLELNKIYNMDCLEGLKLIPDKSVDLILTDPPYGVNLNYDIYNDTMENWYKLIDNILPLMLLKSKKVVMPVCNINSMIYIIKNFEAPKWRLCWYKGSPGQRTPIAGFQDWEELFVWGEGFKPGIHDFFKVVPEKFDCGHPCPKPRDWARFLIRNFSKPNELILDPFTGSGTTLSAAKELNRNFIGFEISKEYCDIANKRLEQENIKRWF